MFGSIGFQELMVILLVALLIFGPRKLPEIGRALGRTLREFRRASEEVTRSFEEPLEEPYDRGGT